MADTTLTLCVFIDAFGWRILERHDFLADLLPVRGPVETIFGYSSTCDPTILTGKLPRDHGHFSFFYYSPSTSPFRALKPLGLLPEAVAGRARVRRVLSRMLAGRLGYTGYFQLYSVPFWALPQFDYSEKRDLYMPGGINGGCTTIMDDVRRMGVPHYCSDWRLPEPDNLASLRARIDQGGLRFAYLYLASMDGVLHSHGTQSPLVGRKIAEYDRELRAVIAQAQTRHERVRVFVFSDHGMADVTATCDLQARMRATGLRFGKDYVAMYDSTMARFWFLTDGARAATEKALGAETQGRVLTDADLARYGCDFPGRKYGELFFVADSGVLICPSFMGLRPIPGMHGYVPDHPDSTAMFATNAMDVAPPARLDGIYPIMRAEVGA
jgi:hypothetical protein